MKELDYSCDLQKLIQTKVKQTNETNAWVILRLRVVDLIPCHVLLICALRAVGCWMPVSVHDMELVLAFSLCLCGASTSLAVTVHSKYL